MNIILNCSTSTQNSEPNSYRSVASVGEVTEFFNGIKLEVPNTLLGNKTFFREFRILTSFPISEKDLMDSFDDMVLEGKCPEGDAFHYISSGFNTSFFTLYHNGQLCAYFLRIPYGGAFMDNEKARTYISRVMKALVQYECSHEKVTEKILITDFGRSNGLFCRMQKFDSTSGKWSPEYIGSNPLFSDIPQSEQ
ncbi:MAG: hypothetical protein LBJ75_04645 [Puniceicoccales bacterium]|jgi:hypothetical protein|nr:hypothetical protein [Puniceicoccales bacterium]